jgi:hypothetical protein
MTRREISSPVLFLLIVATCTSGCGWIVPQGGRPDVSPEAPNVVSLDPSAWYIFNSGGMPAHPSESTEGAWSFDFPMNPGGVGYVETPFQTTETLSSVTITFRVVNNGAQYVVSDPTDIPPATFRLIIEQQGDNLADPNGRWWDDTFIYNLGSQDNQTLSVTIPITLATWSNVNGQHDADGFAAAMKNIGWVGVTFGGQYFAGHGAALSSGSAQFVLIDYHFN